MGLLVASSRIVSCGLSLLPRLFVPQEVEAASGERMDHMFRIRMTTAERREIDRAAKAGGESASEWARALLLRAARRQRKAGESNPIRLAVPYASV